MVYQCPHCTSTLKRKTGLDTHIKKYHAETNGPQGENFDLLVEDTPDALLEFKWDPFDDVSWPISKRRNINHYRFTSAGGIK